MYRELKLKQITDEACRDIQGALGNRLRKVILFGSYARGDYDGESDIDIMVLADIGDNEKAAMQQAIDQISSNISLHNDITVFIALKDQRFFDAHANILPFYRQVASEGVEIYGLH